MASTLNFGLAPSGPLTTGRDKTGPFRIALLGDFSGGANRGRLETGADLARRKPLRVDCDNLDEILARLKISLQLSLCGSGGSTKIAIESMDDFHPEQLYANLEIFTELSNLRQRLKSSSTFPKALAELQSWTGVNFHEPEKSEKTARGSRFPITRKLSDFSQLLGRPSAASPDEISLAQLLQRVVAPHIVAAPDTRQEAALRAIDQALASTMRGVLHDPDFQTLEALWRSVDFLVRRLETNGNLQIVLYDLSAEELAADLSQADSLEKTGLYSWLIEQPASDAHAGPVSAFIGLYTFDRTPPQAELLGRLAHIVALAPAPFVSALSSDVLNQNPKDLHPLIKDAWKALSELPEAAYLGLIAPRFLLRLPYGQKTEPVDVFDFEEFTAKTGLRGMLWGNPAVAAALLLGQTYLKSGANLTLGSVLTIDNLPFYYYIDADGDQTALPCTERLLTSRSAALLTTQNLMPLLAMKGAPEIRLGGFGSLAGRRLAGLWAPLDLPSAAAAVALNPSDSESAPVAQPPSENSGATTDSTAGSHASPIAEPPSADAELDALLAELGSQVETTQAQAAKSETDPELEALLRDLA